MRLWKSSDDPEVVIQEASDADVLRAAAEIVERWDGMMGTMRRLPADLCWAAGVLESNPLPRPKVIDVRGGR